MFQGQNQSFRWFQFLRWHDLFFSSLFLSAQPIRNSLARRLLLLPSSALMCSCDKGFVWNCFLLVLISDSSEPCLLEPFKPRVPPARGEGAGAAVPPVSMQPPPRELTPHVWVPDTPGRASVWREHGNLCWEEKQLGKCWEIGDVNFVMKLKTRSLECSCGLSS